MGERFAFRDVLAVGDARALIAGSASARLGEWLYNAALLGYVYGATGSAGWVAAAAIGRLLPYVLLAPVGAAVAKRYPERTVLLAGDALRLALMIALAALVDAHASVGFVIALTVMVSVAGCAEKPATLALVPRLAGESRLGAAGALLRAVQDIGVAAGAAIAAILLAVAPDSVAFLANGAIFAVSAVFISTIRDRSAAIGAPAGGPAHIAQSLRTIASTSFAVPLLLVVAMAELTYGAQTVQLVVYADGVLGLGNAGYGVLLTALGVGGLLGAITNARLAAMRSVVLVIVGGVLLLCVTQLVYAGFDVLAIALVAAVVGGGGLVVSEMFAETALARIVSPEALGRFARVHDASSAVALVAGGLLAPILIAWTSLPTSLLLLGAAAVLITLACVVALRGLDEVSRRRAEAMASQLALIERLPVSAGVPQLVLERLAAAAHTCPLPPGVDVVVEGAPAHAFYAVVDGRVVVHRDGDTLAHLGSGDSFGERGLLDNAPRNATVTTETDTTLLRVEGHALLDALQAAPALRPALDRSSPAPGAPAHAVSALVDDERWVGA